MCISDQMVKFRSDPIRLFSSSDTGLSGSSDPPGVKGRRARALFFSVAWFVDFGRPTVGIGALPLGTRAGVTTDEAKKSCKHAAASPSVQESPCARQRLSLRSPPTVSAAKLSVPDF